MEENVLRFQGLIRAMIEFLRNEAEEKIDVYRDQAYDQRAMALSLANFLLRETVDSVVTTVCNMVPPPIQSLLGQHGLKASDLLALPGIPGEGTNWGVYIDIATLVATLAVEGTYVGSSVGLSYPGLFGRVRWHLRIAAKKYVALSDYLARPDSLKSKHYQTICREDVTTGFRLIGITAAAECNRLPVGFLEAVTCTYFNTVSTTAHSHNPASTIDLIKRCRKHVNKSGHGNLPDFGALGLNGASPLHQGISVQNPQKKAHRKWAKTHPDVCGNPNCGKPRNMKYPWRFHDFKDKTRCLECHAYRKLHGVDDPAPRRAHLRGGTYVEHQAWVKAGNPDVCQSCRTPRPADYAAKYWVGYCEESQCKRCYARYLRAKAKAQDLGLEALPTTHIGIHEHRQWVSLGNPDVCGSCEIPRPKDYTAKGWIGFREDSRCRACHTREKRAAAKVQNGQPVTIQVGIKQHRAWVARGNPDVCGSCKIPRPDNYKAKQWRGFCENSRCCACRRLEKRAKDKAKAKS